MQKAMVEVEPFGEDRDDVRHKMNTLFAKCVNEENFDERFAALTNYTGDEEPNGELEANEAALKKVVSQNGQRS